MSSIVVMESLPGSVAHLALNDSTQKLNTLTERFWRELDERLDEVMRGSFQGVILSSQKPGQFVAGADLREIRKLMDRSAAEITQAMEIGRKALAKLANMPAATLAAIGGHCLGGGLELALACDARIVAHDANIKLGLPETRLGLIPGWGGTQRLPRLIGVRPAAEMIVTGLPISASQAKTVGVADELCEPESLLLSGRNLLNYMTARGEWNSQRSSMRSVPTFNSTDRVFLTELANRSSSSPLACAKALEVVENGWQAPLETGLKYESDAFAELMKTDAARDAVDAFLAKSATRKGEQAANG